MQMKTKAMIRGGAAMALTLAALSASADEGLRFWTTEEQPERLARQEAMFRSLHNSGKPTQDFEKEYKFTILVTPPHNTNPNPIY